MECFSLLMFTIISGAARVLTVERDGVSLREVMTSLDAQHASCNAVYYIYRPSKEKM